MKNLERLLMDTAAQLFAAGADAEIQEGAENGEFPHQLWQELDDNGLLSALLSEQEGGAGLAPSGALAMMRVAGAMALPLPLAETLWGRYLLTRMTSGSSAKELAVELGASPLVLVSADAAGLEVEERGEVARVSGRMRLPWPVISRALVVAEDSLVVVAPTSPQRKLIDLELSLSGEPNGVLELDGCDGTLLLLERAGGGKASLEEESLQFLSAAHCQRIAGGLERILDLAIEHVQGREQFGRTISKFQAVQHLVAQLAGEAAVVGAAADAITAQLADESGASTIAVAAARSRANEAAATGSRIAHQLLGAIGYTREHSLHRFTRRLLRWRDEHGDEGFWQQRVGAAALEAGGDGLWQLLVD